MTQPPDLVPIEAIRAAAERIRGTVRRTPLLAADRSAGPLPIGDGTLWLKCRGAYNFIASLTPTVRADGVVTYSSGNHAQGVAFAAREFDVPAVVVMPVDAPGIKVEAVRRLGAELVHAGTTTVERKARAEEILASRGGTMVPPFDHPDIIAGQGTVGLEIVEQLEEASARWSVPTAPRLVIVPIGGGGLISGVAVAIRSLAPGARVVGVEPEGAPKMRRSLEAGHPITLDRIDTIADGLRPVRPGDLTFVHTRELVDEVVTVDDAAIRAAVLWCHRQRLVVEPSGAAAVAALRAGCIEAAGSSDTVAVLSGGNLDPSILRGWLSSTAGVSVGIGGAA
jgi:threonine dehydratase